MLVNPLLHSVASVRKALPTLVIKCGICKNSLKKGCSFTFDLCILSRLIKKKGDVILETPSSQKASSK